VAALLVRRRDLPDMRDNRGQTVKALPRLFYNINKLFCRLPKPTAVGTRLVLVKDGDVLLVKHAYQGHWYPPGGVIRKGENLLFSDSIGLV